MQQVTIKRADVTIIRQDIFLEKVLYEIKRIISLLIMIKGSINTT